MKLATRRELSQQIAHVREIAELTRVADKEALSIALTAAKEALGLAREIQAYKDERANNLREQITAERGIYATKDQLAPVTTYIAGQQGQSKGIGLIAGAAVVAFGIGVGAAGVIVAVVK